MQVYVWVNNFQDKKEDTTQNEISGSLVTSRTGSNLEKMIIIMKTDFLFGRQQNWTRTKYCETGFD
jgi:hypothetical protein